MARPVLDESAPPLEVSSLEVEISGTPILHGADLRIDRGELVAVVGPNGAGKSTLARSAAGLQKHAAGEVRWMGQDVRRLRGRALAKIRAFVPQRPRVPAGVSVRDAVRIGRSAHIGPLQRPTHAGPRRRGARDGARRCHALR